MKKIKTMTRSEALKIALLAGIIIAVVTPLCTGVVDGLCFLWTAPLIILTELWKTGLDENWRRLKNEQKGNDFSADGRKDDCRHIVQKR